MKYTAHQVIAYINSYRIFLRIRRVLSDFLDPKNIDASYLSVRLVCWRLIFFGMITAWNKKYLHVQFKSTIFVWSNNAVEQGYSDTETVFSFEQCRNPPDGPIIPTMLQRVYFPWPCFHSINAAMRLAFGPTDVGGGQTFFCVAGYSFRKRMTVNNFIQTSFTQPLLCGKLRGFLL